MGTAPRGDILIETANQDSPGEINYRPPKPAACDETKQKVDEVLDRPDTD